MKKNVDEACEMLEATKADLEKAMLVIAMDNKVNMEVTTIRNKIDFP